MKELKKHIPDARVAYLAYQDTVVPPSEIGLSDGVFLEYALLEKYTAKGEDAAKLIDPETKIIEPLMRFFHLIRVAT